MEILTIAKGEQDITTIADKLYISYHTARGHINSIKKKLQLQDLREATNWISYLHILQSPQEKYAKGTYCSTANPTFNKELNDIQALLDKNKVSDQSHSLQEDLKVQFVAGFRKDF